MAKRVSLQDRKEFRNYCYSVTPKQLEEVYEKERAANRRVFKNIASEVAEDRGLIWEIHCN